MARKALIFPVLALGLLASLQHWLSPRRPAPVELRAAYEILVSSTADAGPGSLRQALLDAAGASARTRIEIAVDRIVLEDPLPPLLHPQGTVIDAGGSGCEIDASRILDGGVFDVRAPDSALAGLTIRDAFGFGVDVRADRVLLDGLTVENAGDGVRVAQEVSALEVRNCEFRANSTGIRVQPGARQLRLHNNRFDANEDAAIWAVAAEPGAGADLEIFANRFLEDRISLVLGNGSATVEGNLFRGAFETAIHVVGRGVVVRSNRIRDTRMGIVADHATGSLIASNEIDHSQVAVLLTSAAGPVVTGNRFHGNLSGVAMVLSDESTPGVLSGNIFLAQDAAAVELVGSSPRVEGNRFLESRRADLRLSDYRTESVRVRSEPTLEKNLLAEIETDIDPDTSPDDETATSAEEGTER